MDILVLMEVAYQMAKFGDNYKLKEHITITIYTIKYFFLILVEANKIDFHKLRSSTFQLYNLLKRDFDHFKQQGLNWPCINAIIASMFS